MTVYLTVVQDPSGKYYCSRHFKPDLPIFAGGQMVFRVQEDGDQTDDGLVDRLHAKAIAEAEKRGIADIANLTC